MSSPDPKAASRKPARFALAGMAALFLFAAGCTVQPLYGTGGLSAGGNTPGAVASLADVEVAPVGTRVAQQVRNNLIFGFTGGQGRTDQPRYRLELAVSAAHSSAATIQRVVDDEPTSQTVTVTTTYTLTDLSTGQPLTRGNRSAMAAYDLSRQEFASQRARIDAEDRAAREVAELVRMVVASELLRRQPGS